ncbi:DUF948 domain-containing protein [Isobaculum melis]|uniref:Uncharacterized protein YoxC, contains an MCP-like domain n=1 Tax=Isobaculum melis TaxID=142588 RepID=A0A1H9RJ72_9LACT|nr:DUF948 domain-containing protein [Isobaculum melis]SER72782.1 Uncharacterized protein YoxC, contains an MCP-like domain [Isobaculum melis]
MTGVEIAAVIAAGASAVLVLFLVFTLLKVMKVLSKLSDTAEQANESIRVITKDVDHLAIEVESLLSKTNTLMDDLNGKLQKTDPLFNAVGDLGTSVSDLNESSRNLVSRVSGATKKTAQVSAFTKMGSIALKFHKNRQAKKQLKKEQNNF